MHYSTSILYLNMGGEMLYILQQRLHTYRISSDKTIQVMNEVIGALLDSKQLKIIFDKSLCMNLCSVRTMLEQAVLSSIIKLDGNSMNKLFDLMIMMAKYQMDTVTGPREVVLLTLNHIDAMRSMVVDRTLITYVNLVHRLILDTFGNMNHKDVWQVRDDCLREIKDYNVRVSVLLRLGMQNQDGTFNRIIQKYNEHYLERKDVLENIKLLGYSDDKYSTGSLSLLGDRVTLLGKNLYSCTFEQALNNSSTASNVHQTMIIGNMALKQELKTLAVHLGKEEELVGRPLSLHLFTYDNKNIECNSNRLKFDNASTAINVAQEKIFNDKNQSANEYKRSLVNSIDLDFSNSDAIDQNPMDLMNLLDEL